MIKPTISACVLARNEERRIEDALKSLRGWTDQILVIDNESNDRTVEIARRYTDQILTAPRALNFDAARNLAIEPATGDWIFYLDADERVPARLGEELRRLIEEEGDQFEALLIPFKNFFCGKWMQHSTWWPGYTRPQLLKKGCFRYNERLHSGVQVDGRTRMFPADNPDLAIDHYSYDDLHHYLAKLNRYTDGEAESLHHDGASHSWQAQLAHFVHDWQVYYERGRADLDGMHGFVLAFMSGFYRFLSRAKLWDRRRRQGELWIVEPVPSSVREMLEFMVRVVREGAAPWLEAAYPRIELLGEVTPPEWSAASSLAGSEREAESGEEGPRITACILARNEEGRIEGALRSLQGWADEILVIDNESDDRTVEIARRYTEQVLSTPPATHFDGARNLAIEHATGEWLFFLDADERIPPRLGSLLRGLVREHGEEFEALCLPFKNIFYGQWMQSGAWWPGYAGPRLLKKGSFEYGTHLHSGAQVNGRKRHLPADDPELAIVHYAYDDLHHYLEKLNHYTDGEAESRDASGQGHSWQAQLAHFVHDWQVHYEHGRADRDGMHGFVQSFLCAFYRFTTRAKIWDRRRLRGEVARSEPVPTSLGEMLEFMAQVAQEGAGRWLTVQTRTAVPALPPDPASIQNAKSDSAAPVPLLWRAPLWDPSGYADESRQFVMGLIEAGEPIAVVPERWSEEEAGLRPQVRAAIEERVVPPDTPAEVGVFHTLLGLQHPLPNAGYSIGRTMFETDRLPAGAAARLNQMDRIWVPSAFNRGTFIQSGVALEKIAIIPEAIDPTPFADPDVEPWPVPGREEYRFLSVFDWTLHKGWDVLLEAFAREFGGAAQHADTQDAERDEETGTGTRGAGGGDGGRQAAESVGLILKVWSSNGYTLEDIRTQADALLREKLGRGLADFPNIHLWQEMIPASTLPQLYRAVDAFVLPTRGEGWCRPLMEAMAAGKPSIATAWSGLTAFHNEAVGYPRKCALVPFSDAGARELPLYAGHNWAEPDLDDLRRLMRQLVEAPEAAHAKGQAAQETIAEQYSRPVVAAILKEELAYCQAQAKKKGAALPVPAPAAAPPASARPRPVPHKPNANPIPRPLASPVDFRSVLGRPLRVRWEGDQTLLSSLARVNREFCLGLLAAGDVELSLAESHTPWHTLTEADDARFGPLFACLDAPLSGPPDITVRHHFPPNWRRPETGKLVVMQPWELSHLPERSWLEGAIHHADEVWANSRFVRDTYVRSGVPAEKVRLVPLGFNPELFNPDGPRYALPTRKEFRLLFVGGALERKGADLLLEAYRRAFTPDDDVCLVVKDMGTRTFYQGQTIGEAFRRMAADPNAPEVIYLDQDLSDEELAALYRACTCVVAPYRGEGFCLPPLEGMACGLPSIVTAGGPTEDYLDDTMALRVPHHRVIKPGLYRGPGANLVDPWELEPDLDALVDALRWAYRRRPETQGRGEVARAHAHAGWTWDQAVRIARARLLDLVAPPHEQVVVPARLWSEPKASKKGRKGARVRERVELSLCMIARDEAPRIAECLKGIAPHVDEMIVVDTGSKDCTREIAGNCGARVFDFPWTDSFAEARNQSIDQARGDWIFWMDADDVISPRAGVELRRLIRQHPDRDAAFQALIRIPPGPGEFSPTIVDHVKLFPNRPDLRFEHRIHEQILPSIRRAGLQVLFSEVFVTHQNYDRSKGGQAKKRARDFRLLELDLKDRPDHPFVLFNLGMTYLYATKEYEVAAHYLRRSLDRSDWQDSIVRKAYAMLTVARTAQGEWGLALQANEEGRRFYPDDAELLYQAGQIYQQLGGFEEARRALERLVQGEEDPHYRSVDVGLRTYRGWHELALLFQRMGDGAHCEQVLREIAATQPTYLPAQLDLVETLQRLGKSEEAQRLLTRIPSREAIRVDLERLREQVGAR